MNTTLAKVYERDAGICWLCQRVVEEDTASVDHVLPRSMGGTRAQRNLRLAHKSCNSERGNAFPGERPHSPPRSPTPKKRLKPYQIAAAARRERIKDLMRRMNGGEL